MSHGEIGVCAICKDLYSEFGNNGWPVTLPEERVCDFCNDTVVVPTRIARATGIGMREDRHELAYGGMGNYRCTSCGTPTLGWPCPNGPNKVPMNPNTGLPVENGSETRD